MPKVRLSDSARDYLTKEARYLRDRNPAAAIAFLARMRQARQLLEDFPEMGTGKEGLPHSDLRCLVAGDYLIDYRILGDVVRILSIRHGRQLDVSIELDDDDFDGGDDTPPSPA